MGLEADMVSGVQVMGLVLQDTDLGVLVMGLGLLVTVLGALELGLGVLEPELVFPLECLSFPRRVCLEGPMLLQQLLLRRRLPNCQVWACLVCTKEAWYQDMGSGVLEFSPAWPPELDSTLNQLLVQDREEQAQEAVAMVGQCNPGCSMGIR